MPDQTNRPQYAARTDIEVDESRNQIERLLKKYGATQFVYGWHESLAQIGFAIDGRQIKIDLRLPGRSEFSTVKCGARGVQPRKSSEMDSLWQQSIRSRWRALALVVKAKLVAVEAGITTIEREFLADMVIPGGETVGSWMAPQLEEAYRSGKVPQLLPGLTVRSLPERSRP